MKSVGAGLCYERDLRSRGAPLVRPVIRRRDAKFLHGIQGNGQDRREGVAARLVIHVHSIESDVALVTACAVHGTVASIKIRIIVSTVPPVRDSCLEREQVRNVAPFQRKCLYLILIEGGT